MMVQMAGVGEQRLDGEKVNSNGKYGFHEPKPRQWDSEADLGETEISAFQRRIQHPDYSLRLRLRASW